MRYVALAAGAAAILAGGPARADDRAPAMDAALAGRFLKMALDCADREYPNKPSHVYEDDAQIRPPREVTPAFFGCFDWHSAVHGHWTLARLATRFPDLPDAARALDVLKRHLAPANVAREAAFLAADRNRTFERPYGWGWLLRLDAELRAAPGADAAALAAATAPLAAAVADRFADWLPRLSRPLRDGTHPNTAFAMAHALDWARVAGDRRLEALLAARARDFYGSDTGCPVAYEPSGEDFLSPCLAEADLMRRVLPRAAFAAWLARFLPRLGDPRFRALATPPEVRDPKDPRIGHLVGLDFHRAWAFRGVASALPARDPRRARFLALADLHLREGLRLLEATGYGGGHWLASFATLVLTGAGE